MIYIGTVLQVWRTLHISKQSTAEIMEIEHTALLLAPIGVVAIGMDAHTSELRLQWKPPLWPKK